MDFYEVLGIERSAEASTIREAYRRRALKFHPVHSEDPDSVAEFKRISEAYHVLSSQERKALYDVHGFEVLTKGVELDGGRIGGAYAFDSTSDPLRIFKEVFATANPYEAIYSDGNAELLTQCAGVLTSYTPAKQGEDKRVPPLKTKPVKRRCCVKIEFSCELEEVFSGCDKTLHHARRVKAADGAVTEVVQELFIRIEPGAEDGAVFSFSKCCSFGPRSMPCHIMFRLGDVEPRVIPGKVDYVLRIRPHGRFTREGRNLVVHKHLPIYEAFLNVPIEGTAFCRQFAVVVPDILTPGYRHVIRGEGMQSPDGTRGDLILEFSFVFPKWMSPLQKALIKSSFLFPSSPSSDQLRAANAFSQAARHTTVGWLNGIPQK